MNEIVALVIVLGMVAVAVPASFVLADKFTPPPEPPLVLDPGDADAPGQIMHGWLYQVELRRQR